MSFYDHPDYDLGLYDEQLEAEQEARREKADEALRTCVECGTEYDPGYHRATRYEPAWAERECPECGCTEVH